MSEQTEPSIVSYSTDEFTFTGYGIVDGKRIEIKETVRLPFKVQVTEWQIPCQASAKGQP